MCLIFFFFLEDSNNDEDILLGETRSEENNIPEVQAPKVNDLTSLNI